jgi:hypothetical protein
VDPVPGAALEAVAIEERHEELKSSSLPLRCSAGSIPPQTREEASVAGGSPVVGGTRAGDGSRSALLHSGDGCLRGGEGHMPEPILTIYNHHTAGCGTPPAFTGKGADVYIGYFENRHGKQWSRSRDGRGELAGRGRRLGK